jgi:hypothetical protein
LERLKIEVDIIREIYLEADEKNKARFFVSLLIVVSNGKEGIYLEDPPFILNVDLVAHHRVVISPECVRFTMATKLPKCMRYDGFLYKIPGLVDHTVVLGDLLVSRRKEEPWEEGFFSFQGIMAPGPEQPSFFNWTSYVNLGIPAGELTACWYDPPYVGGKPAVQHDKSI